MLWSTGRFTQLARSVRIDIAPSATVTDVECDIGGVVAAARGGAPRSKRRRQGSCGRVVRRRCVVLWRTGHRSQLDGKVHVKSTP